MLLSSCFRIKSALTSLSCFSLQVRQQEVNQSFLGSMLAALTGNGDSRAMDEALFTCPLYGTSSSTNSRFCLKERKKEKKSILIQINLDASSTQFEN